MLAQTDRAQSGLIGGIPVDSEYVIFIIDTSGSMHSQWDNVIKQLITTLDVYPRLQGIQIMSDMGEYLFSQYRRKWIPDTADRRRVIIRTLRGWGPFSNSSPVEGITQAIRTFYDPGKKISIYVYGDEFSGSIRQVLDAVERINPKDQHGNTKVRIHAVGFPFSINATELTNLCFAGAHAPAHSRERRGVCGFERIGMGRAF